MKKLKNGGAITNTGYLPDSPDRFNDYNIIPSNQITMKKVKYKILGTDDQGNQQIMHPGMDYTFPGNYVTEVPIKQDGGVTNPPQPSGFAKFYNKLAAGANNFSGNYLNELSNPYSLSSTLNTVDYLGNTISGIQHDNINKNYLRDHLTSDNLFPAVQGSRGDYSTTGSSYGGFRPDQQGAQSPYGMFNSKFYQSGGGYITPDINDNLSQQTNSNINPNVLGAIPDMPAIGPQANPNSVIDFPKYNSGKNVNVNSATKDAYNYYIKEKGLPSQVAAGIVGNLYQESGLKPGAVETTNTAAGRGIAQWGVDGRWQGFLNWAKQNQRDPYNVKSQLDYVLVEPGESQKAIDRIKNVSSPEQAAVIFGKMYERPAERAANWDTRTSVASKLASGTFAEGGEPGKPNPASPIVDHYKQQMLNTDGKYLITDKGTNRTYYGYKDPTGKLIEGNFEVLTGKAKDNDYYSPYSVEDLQKMSPEDQDKRKTTPVGSFNLKYNSDIYGNPGLNLQDANGIAMHTTYDPTNRDKLYSNNNLNDNYASYGCINCHKDNVNQVLKGFGTNDKLNIIDSRRSVEDNDQLFRDNKMLKDNPLLAKMLFEQNGSEITHRTLKDGIYYGQNDSYNPKTDTITENTPLNEVNIKASRLPKQDPAPIGNYTSIVDYLNDQGMDYSKDSRKQLAQSIGMKDYNFTKNDNINLLNFLQSHPDYLKTHKYQDGGDLSDEDQTEYQVGGEYIMTEKELKQFLKSGGEVSYI